MSAERSLSAAVLTHNAGTTIGEVLDGLDSQSVQPHSVLVVDNGSDDDTVLQCTSRRVQVIEQPNLGVGAGHAAALRTLFQSAEVEYVLMLEHDTVPAHTCVQNLVTVIDELVDRGDDVGAITCAVLHPDEDVDRIADVEAGRIDIALAPARRITFNGLLVSWDTFARVGFPRSDLFVGQEDNDLFTRLRRSGIPVRCAHQSVVKHSGKGRERRNEMLPRTRALYSARNGTYRDLYIEGHAARALARLGRVALRRVRSGPEMLSAVRGGLRGDLGPLSKATLES